MKTQIEKIKNFSNVQHNTQLTAQALAVDPQEEVYL